MTTSGSRVVLMTYEEIHGIESPVRTLLKACAERGVELCIDSAEKDRERLAALGLSIVENAVADPDVGLCISLGGDGTILRALRVFAGTGVPVFAVNFGQVGFLATAEPVDLVETFAQALDGHYDRLEVPAVTVTVDGDEAGPYFGINDVSVHRTMGARVAELGYGVDGAIIGSVRCDGLVACTPAGSTGYNLANGGPIMAWGVEGYAVSFIAPHSLTARSIVVSPIDHLIVENRARSRSSSRSTGARAASTWPPGGDSRSATAPLRPFWPSSPVPASTRGCARSSVTCAAERSAPAEELDQVAREVEGGELAGAEVRVRLDRSGTPGAARR